MFFSFVKTFKTAKECFDHLEKNNFISFGTSPHIKGKNNISLNKFLEENNLEKKDFNEFVPESSTQKSLEKNIMLEPTENILGEVKVTAFKKDRAEEIVRSVILKTEREVPTTPPSGITTELPGAN